MMKPIVFNLGEESRPKIESLKDMGNSLFREQYIKAFKEIKEYVHNEIEVDGYDLEHKNNIFAFIGERGSGKTSCMLSVSNMLINTSTKDKNDYPDGIYLKEIEKQFEEIDLIDPSFFDQKNNILNIVIAKLFKNFSKKAKDSTSNHQTCDTTKKQKLLEEFQKTKENLNLLINNNDLSEDSLEQLVGLSAAIDLKENVGSLINAYLEYVSNTEKRYLIIKLDDIDLHTQHAHDMVEQIRKYLIHPRVIILMSIKLDQLALVKRMHFADEFRTLLKEKKIDFSTIENMVDRYLVKLVPLNNRIFLPNAEVYFDRKLTIKQEKSSTIYNSVKEAIPALIFKKTRFLFYNKKGTTSYIVPTNLRELRHLFKLLFDMPNYRDEGRPEYNKTMFKKYLFETWTINNLIVDDQRLVKDILLISDAITFNKTVLNELKLRFPNQTSFPQSSEFYYILNDSNQTYNVSVGDVLSFILYLEGITPKIQDHKLFFIIKTIYSIKLYEYYDELTEEIVDNEENENENEEKIKIPEVYRYEYIWDYSKYEKLIAGRFINTSLIDIIPQSRNKEVRSQRDIDGSIILKIINQLEKNISSIEIDEKISLTRIEALNLVEFFILTISRKYNSQDSSTNDNADKLFRTKRDIIPYYYEELKTQNKNLYFDVMALFFNLINIKSCYNRFSSLKVPFYELAIAEPASLLNKLNKLVCYREDKDTDYSEINSDYINHRRLSWICIRNIEVLETLIAELQMSKPKGEGANNILVFKNFFQAAKKFNILSYDIDEINKKHYHIDFLFLSLFEEFLDDTNDIVFESVFNTKKSTTNLLIKNKNLNIRLGLKKKNTYKSEDLLGKLLRKNDELNNEEKQRIVDIFGRLFLLKEYKTIDTEKLFIELKEQFNG
jgi:hypothetical protein